MGGSMSPFDVPACHVLLPRSAVVTVRDLAHARAIVHELPGAPLAALEREQLAAALCSGELVFVRPRPTAPMQAEDLSSIPLLSELASASS